MGRMAENSDSRYQPGLYTKGEVARRASTRADAVQAVFDGFTLQTPAAETETVTDETDEVSDDPTGEPIDETDPSRSYSSFSL